MILLVFLFPSVSARSTVQQQLPALPYCQHLSFPTGNNLIPYVAGTICVQNYYLSLDSRSVTVVGTLRQESSWVPIRILSVDLAASLLNSQYAIQAQLPGPVTLAYWASTAITVTVTSQNTLQDFESLTAQISGSAQIHFQGQATYCFVVLWFCSSTYTYSIDSIYTVSQLIAFWRSSTQ